MKDFIDPLYKRNLGQNSSDLPIQINLIKQRETYLDVTFQSNPRMNSQKIGHSYGLEKLGLQKKIVPKNK